MDSTLFEGFTAETVTLSNTVNLGSNELIWNCFIDLENGTVSSDCFIYAEGKHFGLEVSADARFTLSTDMFSTTKRDRSMDKVFNNTAELEAFLKPYVAQNPAIGTYYTTCLNTIVFLRSNYKQMLVSKLNK